MKAEAIGRKAIRVAKSIINNTVLVVFVLMIAFAGYALWDSKQLHKSAGKSVYEVYKPTAANGGKTFKELQVINDEVIGWLTVYGTNIDYPVTQAPNNEKYVNTNAEGRYSLSGAIFLDANNSKDFSDFNSIIYGHHMAKKVMFGEIGEFSDRNVFDANKYGNLYFDGKDHGLEFFAFVHADAYDHSIFSPNRKEDARQTYLFNLLAKSMYLRDVGVSIDDRIVLLSTCSADSTNGRDILVAKLTDEVFEDPALGAGDEKAGLGHLYGLVKEIPLLLLLTMVLSTLAVARNLVSVLRSRRSPGLAGARRKNISTRLGVVGKTPSG